jgi:hypothetical protein
MIPPNPPLLNAMIAVYSVHISSKEQETERQKPPEELTLKASR